MPDYNDLERKLEDAFAIVIAAYAGALAGTIFTGQDDSELTLPATTIHAQQGAEIQPGTGIYAVAVSVTHTSTADKAEDSDTPRATHNARVAKVRDAIHQDTMVALLNAAGVAELTVVDVFSPTQMQGKDSDSRQLESGDVLRVIAGAAAI